jgi:MFS family permease
MAVLMFWFSVVNFSDKLVMSLAAVPVMREFNLSPGQYGMLSSSFYMLYAVSGLLVGLFLVRRVSPKWLLAALVMVWTVSQVPVVFGVSLLALFSGRILLGVGEGPATPGAYHALYGWFDSDRRNLPTSLLIAGTGAGFLLGAPLLTHVIADWGWRSGFLVCGGAGLLWLAAWITWGTDGPLLAEPAVAGTHPEVPWRRFWTDPTVMATLATATCSYWVLGLSITWLAPYLQLGLHYSPRDTGWLVSVILGSQIVVQFAISYLSQRLLAAGWSSRVGRGLINGAAVLAAAAALAAAPIVEQGGMKVLLLAAGFTLPQLSFVLGPAILGEITPTAQRGTALLVAYSVITLAGLASPIVTGWILRAAGGNVSGYVHAFWLTSAVLAMGGIWGLVALDPERSRARLLQRSLDGPQKFAESSAA